MELLGAAVPPALVRPLLLECLNGVKCKARTAAADLHL